MRAIVLAMAGAGLSLAGGCTTLSRGSHQSVTFAADAPGAVVEVQGKRPMEAPATIELSRKRKYTVVVRAPGRQGVEFTMKSGFDGVSLGNLIYPGGSVGVLVDFLTGADKKFKDLGKIELPVLAEAAEPSSLVRVYPYKGKLRTREEIRAMQQEATAETAADTADNRDDTPPSSGG